MWKKGQKMATVTFSVRLDSEDFLNVKAILEKERKKYDTLSMNALIIRAIRELVAREGATNDI